MESSETKHCLLGNIYILIRYLQVKVYYKYTNCVPSTWVLTYIVVGNSYATTGVIYNGN